MRKLLILTLVAGSVLVANAQVNSPRADGYTLRGELMDKNSIFIGALDQTGFALDLDPSLPDERKAEYYRAMSAANHHEANAITLLKGYLEKYPAGGERHVVALAIADCLFNQGHYAEALRDYNHLSPASFDSARAGLLRLHRGFCLLKLADYGEAQKEFSALRGSRLYGNTARFYEAYVAYALEDYKQATALFKEVNTSSSPGNMADYYLAQIYFHDRDFNKAISAGKRLLKNADSSVPSQFTLETRRIVGEALYEKGDDSQALPYIEQYVLESANPLPSARYILGVNQYRLGQYEKSIESLTPVTEQINAMGQSAYLFIGQDYLKLNETDAATMAFHKASQMDFDPEVTETALYNYAVTNVQGGRVPFVNTVGTLEEFLTRYPRSRYAAEVQQYVVNGYLTESDYDKALRAINAVPSPNEATLRAKQQVLYALGTRDLENGDTAGALKRLVEARGMSGYNSRLSNECNLWIGQCLYNQKRYPEAAEAFLAFLKGERSTEVNTPIAYYNLGYTRFAQKKYADAYTDFSKFVLAPGDSSPQQLADAYNRMADCQYYAGDFAQAAQYYDKAYHAYPAAGDYSLYQQAIMAGLRHDYASKISGLRTLMRDFPRSSLVPQALLAMADAQTEQGDRQAAIATYRQLVERYPTTEQGRQGYLLLAMANIEKGSREEGISYYKTLIERYPSSTQAQVAVDDLKRIYADSGQLDSFVSYLKGVKGAPQLQPEEVQTIYFQSAEKEYATSGNVARLQDYVAKYPDGRDVPAALEYLMTAATNSGDTDKALAYANQIVERFPDTPSAEAALLTKANAEYAQGKGEKALVSYRELESRASTASTKHAARLGMLHVYRDLGRHDEVIKLADQMLATSADTFDKEEVTFARGYAYMSKGNTSKAQEDWAPLAKNPKTLIGAKSAYYLSQMLFDSSSLKAARKQVQALIDSNTSHNYWLARGYILLSDINRKEGKIFEADEYLKVIRDNYPGAEPDIRQMIDSRLK